MRSLRTRTLFVFAAMGASLAGAPATLAQTCIAPPGRAAIEQYCESVPGPGGDRGATADKGKQPRISARAARTRVALERADEEGRELANFLAKAPPAPPQRASQASADAGELGRKAPRGTATGERGVEAGTASEDVASDGVASAVRASSSAGAGALSVVGIAGILALLTLLVVRRRAPR